MTGKTTVRRGGPADVGPALGVWRASHEARLEGRVSPPEHGDRMRGHVENPSAFLFVAESGGGVVGMAVGIQCRAEDGAGPPIEGLCHVSAVFVAPDRWGEGLGGRLVDAVLAEARASGYDRAQLWTHADNARAHRLYDRRGFRRTGREKRDDGGETIVHYQRGLRLELHHKEAHVNKDDWRGQWREANRANWDERVPIHAGGEFYDVAAFKAGEEHLRPFELEEMGDISGRDLLHLQCHFGKDTLSWARRGARVTGLDFSPPAIEEARKLAAEIGIEAEFVQSDVYEAGEALGGRTFDVVYTGLGALNWLPDVGRWAGVAAGLVHPGGFLYLAEFHPFTNVFGDDDLTVEHDYFHKEEPDVWDEPGTYADFDAETKNNVTYEWTHTLSDVVSAIVDAGLVLEFLHEHDHTLFPRWPILEKTGFDTYRLPEGTPRIPLMYSLLARKPR